VTEVEVGRVTVPPLLCLLPTIVMKEERRGGEGGTHGPMLNDGSTWRAWKDDTKRTKLERCAAEWANEASRIIVNVLRDAARVM
jgi:hypothetical protein